MGYYLEYRDWYSAVRHCPMRKLNHAKLRSNDRQAIEAAIRLLKQAYPVDAVILYGSKARGTDDPESDIDLLVLTTPELTAPLRRSQDKPPAKPGVI